jgi:hypothetical protein
MFYQNQYRPVVENNACSGAPNAGCKRHDTERCIVPVGKYEPGSTNKWERKVVAQDVFPEPPSIKIKK